MDEETIKDAARYRYIANMHWDKYKQNLDTEIDYLLTHDKDDSKQLSLPLWD